MAPLETCQTAVFYSGILNTLQVPQRAKWANKPRGKRTYEPPMVEEEVRPEKETTQEIPAELKQTPTS